MESWLSSLCVGALLSAEREGDNPEKPGMYLGSLLCACAVPMLSKQLSAVHLITE